MQLTCPSCGARYRIDVSGWPTEPGPDGELAFKPRKVRCKLCREVWFGVPEEEALELQDPLPPDEGPRPAEAAWTAVGGWSSQRMAEPPLPDPDAEPIMQFQQPPAFPQRPAIGTADAPPVQFQPATPDTAASSSSFPTSRGEGRPAGGRPDARTGPRLPGPAALGSAEDLEAVSRARQDAASEDDDFQYDEGDEGDGEGRTRRWPWILLALLAGLLLLAALVLTGRIRPEDHGLPPLDLSGLPAWANPAGIGLKPISLPRAAPPPLTIEAEAVKRQLPGGREVWDVKASILNPTGKRQPVPPVEAALLDESGQVLGRWTVRPDVTSLSAGEVTMIETTAIDPPEKAERLRLRLKPAEIGRL